jgi:hypothetical protein
VITKIDFDTGSQLKFVSYDNNTKCISVGAKYFDEYGNMVKSELVYFSQDEWEKISVFFISINEKDA